MIKNVLHDIHAGRKTEQLPDLLDYNNSVRQSWIHIWTHNAGENYARIKELFQERDCNVGNLPKEPGVPALVLGSGPSLDDWGPWIKEWKGAIFCSTSQLAWCEYHGVTPTYVFLIDADPHMVYLMEESSFNTHVPLITHPQVPKGVFDAWKGPVWLYRMYDPGDEFSAKYFPMMYGWMNETTNWKLAHYVLNAGNVFNNMLSVAAALEYGPLFMAGYDLGYPGKQWRFTNYQKKEGEWETIPDPGIPEGRPVQEAANGVLHDRLTIYYKYSFMIMYGIASPRVISTCRGAIGEVPYMTPEEAVECKGNPPEGVIHTPWEAYVIAQEYLKPRGIYVFKGYQRRKGAGMSILNKKDLKGWKGLWYRIWWRFKRLDTYRWPDGAFQGKRPYHWLDTWRAVEGWFHKLGEKYNSYLTRLYGTK